MSNLDGILVCALEVERSITGELGADAPQCACPVIIEFLATWHDELPTDQDRNCLLNPLIQEVVGTRSTKEAEKRRSMLAADWLLRVHTPAWLRAQNRYKQASLFESLPEITDFKQCSSLIPALQAIQNDTSAVRAAAMAAARSAALAAARSTISITPWDPKWATISPGEWATIKAFTKSVVRSASMEGLIRTTRSATRDPTWDATWAALKPTIDFLQTSAVELVRRMIAIKDDGVHR